MIDWLIVVGFTRHIIRLHNAEYEVCPHLLCRLAFAVEKRLRWPLWYTESGLIEED